MSTFWKVCPVDEDVNDPDAWGLTFAPTYREAAIEHFKFLEKRTHAGFSERDMIVTPEGGGVAKVFRVRAAAVMTYSSEQMIQATAHA